MGANIGSGSLHWATVLDNTQLKQNAREATKVIDDMGREISRKEVFKGMILQQKELVKSVEEDIKRLKHTYDNMSSGSARNSMGGIGSDLASAKRALREEQAQLITMQQQGVAMNEVEQASQGGLIGSLKGWVLGIVSITAAWKGFKSVMESTEGTAIVLEGALHGLRTGFEYLLKSVATLDFKDFLAGLKGAIKGGKEYIYAKEEIANIERQYGLESLELQGKINEQRRIFYESDPEKQNFDEKIAAGKEMLDLMQEKADKEIEIANLNLQAISDVTNKKNKLTEGEAVWAIKNYKLMEEEGKRYNWLKNLVDQYNTAREQGLMIDKAGTKAYASQGPGLPLQVMTKENYDEYQRQMNEMGPDAAQAGKVLDKYKKLTEQEKQVIYQASADVIKANNQFLQESRMVYRFTENMETRAYKARAEKQKAASEYEEELNQKRLDNALRISQATIDAQANGAQKERDQANLDFEKTLAQLDKEKAEMIKKKNELSGGIKDGVRTAQYDEVLPKDLLQQDEALRIQAEEKKNQKLKEIDIKYKLEMEKIYRDMTGAFLGEIDKQKMAINAKYDEWIRKAKEAGASEDKLAEIELNRIKEINQAEQSASFKLTAYYKKAFGDITTYGYASLKKLLSDTDKIMASARMEKRDGKDVMLIDTEEITAEGEVIKKTTQMTIEEFKQLQERYNKFKEAVRDRNPFKALKEDFKSLLNEMKKPNNAGGIGDALEAFNKSADKSIALVLDLSDSIGDIFGASVDRALKAVIELTKGIKDIGVGVGKVIAGDKVSGVVQILGGLGKIIKTLNDGQKKYSEETQAFWLRMVEATLRYKNVLIDIIQMTKSASDSVFITDYANQIKQASIAINQANKEFYDQIKKSGVLSIINPNFDWNAMFDNPNKESLRLYLKSLLIQVGTVRDSISGIITLGSKPVFGSLLQAFPDLIDQNGKFNTELANTLLSLEGLPETTRVALQGLVDFQKQIEESQQAIESAISSMAGFIANNLRTALMDAWDNGTDAFEAFKTSVSAGLKEIVSQMVFNAVFAQAFKQLQTDMEQSFGTTGDQSITDDLKKFYDQAPTLVQQWLDGMTAAQQEAMAAGMDWGKTNAQDSGKTLTGAIQQDITEQTASIIAGQLNAMQVNIIEQLRVFRESVVYQKQIAENTLRSADILQLINSRVTQEESLRASGL